MIWASAYLLVFIRNLLVNLAEKILLLQPLTLGGLPWRSSDELAPYYFLPNLRKNRTIKPWDQTPKGASVSFAIKAVKHALPG